MSDYPSTPQAYKSNLKVDTTVTYEREENGRTIQYQKGENGTKVITDLGRDPEDLKRAMALLGKNRVVFDEKEKVVTPRSRDGLSVTESVTLDEKRDKSVTQLSESVTDRLCIVCGNPITSSRPDVKTCSPTCRKKASRTK